MSVDLLSVALRALAFLALFQAAGVALFLAFLEHPLPATEPALRRHGKLAALIAALLLASQYVLESARLSGELSGALDPALQSVVMRSATSVTLAWRLLGLLLIALGLRRGGAAGTTISVAGVVLLLAAFTLAAQSVTVPCELLAGIVLASLLLPDFAALRRPYGELLIVKFLAFCALTPIAAANKWRFGPALRRGDGAAARRFRHALAVEYGIIAAVLCLTAVLTTFYSPEG